LKQTERLFGRLKDIRHWNEGLLTQYWLPGFHYNLV